MPNWNEVLKELQECDRKNALDYVRGGYLKKLHEKTGRNIICYYSGFLNKSGAPNLEINDNDKNGFMTCVHNLKRDIGCDLLLHTPGGQVAATESLVDYIRKMFGNDVRAIVPQIAMSAGTMIACSCKEIIMGAQSNIGPVDPQFGGIPAQGVIDEFNMAIKAAKEEPETIPIWQSIVQKYHPTFIQECKHAVDLSGELVIKWLQSNMLAEEADRVEKAEAILSKIGSHVATKTHSRHVHIDEARQIGLNVKSMEDDFDQEFQDLVLTIHHCFMHVFTQSTSLKIVENHMGIRMVEHQKQDPQLVPLQLQGNPPHARFEEMGRREENPKTLLQSCPEPNAYFSDSQI